MLNILLLCSPINSVLHAIKNLIVQFLTSHLIPESYLFMYVIHVYLQVKKDKIQKSQKLVIAVFCNVTEALERQ